MEPRVSLKMVSKHFPGVQALDKISLSILPGEIHSLLGENGAGKSTLGKIIGGVYEADSGEVTIDGKTVDRLDEAEATRLGISMVHQEGSLVRQLSVADNIFAGRQPTGLFGRVLQRKMVEESRAILNQLGVDIDPRAIAATLSSAQAQVVEIAKALSADVKILILDEPTAALTLTETERLFDVARRLKASGVAIIYVSHRLAEIFALCDRVTVLKDGQLMGTRAVAETDTDELIRMMVGRDVSLSRDTAGRTPGKVRLRLEDLSAPPAVRSASFEVRSGEIVCLAGLVGSGRSEVCEAIFGVRARTGGAMWIDGEARNFRDSADAIRAGVGMAPENRKEAGLFLSMDIARNIAVTVPERVTRQGLVVESLAVDLAKTFISELKIASPSPNRPVDDLSGGNQQKVMLAKWLAMKPLLLIVDEPTRGVDVGARTEIYRILRDLACEGVALLVVSSDLPEVLALADRIVVMADGRTVGELDGGVATEEDVLRLATEYTSLPEAAKVEEVEHG